MVADQSVAPWPTNKQRRTCSPCLDILRDRIIGWCYINFTNLIWIKISAVSIRWTHIGDVTFKDWSCIADAAMPVLINSHLDRHENQRRTQCAYRRAEQCPAWMPFLCRYSSHSFWWVRTTASSWLLSACNALWCPPGDHNLHVVFALQIKQTILVSSSKRAELAETITFGVVLTSCIMHAAWMQVCAAAAHPAAADAMATPTLAPTDYWRAVLPDTPMPQAIHDLLTQSTGILIYIYMSTFCFPFTRPIE
jgi:hypothetical protein